MYVIAPYLTVRDLGALLLVNKNINSRCNNALWKIIVQRELPYITQHTLNNYKVRLAYIATTIKYLDFNERKYEYLDPCIITDDFMLMLRYFFYYDPCIIHTDIIAKMIHTTEGVPMWRTIDDFKIQSNVRLLSAIDIVIHTNIPELHDIYTKMAKNSAAYDAYLRLKKISISDTNFAAIYTELYETPEEMIFPSTFKRKKLPFGTSLADMFFYLCYNDKQTQECCNFISNIEDMSLVECLRSTHSECVHQLLSDYLAK